MENNAINKIKEFLPKVQETFKKVNEKIPTPVKKVGNKTAFLANVVNQKLIVLNLILDKSSKIDELINMSQDELAERIKSLDNFNKLNIAILLVAFDIMYSIILFNILIRTIPNSLALLIYKLLIKIVTFSEKKNDEKEAEGKIKKIFSKLKEKSKTVMDKVTVKLGLKEKVEFTYDFSDEIQIGKYAIATGLSGAIAEESSKTIAHLLGIKKQYMIIFNAAESAMYILVFNKSIKDRAKMVMMHLALQFAHKIPKLRKYTYIIHSVVNMLVVVSSTRK